MGERQPLLDLGDRAPCAFGHLLGTLLTCLREHERELVTADAGRQVACAADPCDGAPDLAQDVVTFHVAASPVDLGESLDVHENDAQTSAVAPRALDLAVEGGVEVAVVAKPGEGILEGELIQVVGVAPQLLLGFLADADVLDLRDEVDGLPLGTAHERDAQEAPYDRPVGLQVALLELVAVELTLQDPLDERELGR